LLPCRVSLNDFDSRIDFLDFILAKFDLANSKGTRERKFRASGTHQAPDCPRLLLLLALTRVHLPVLLQAMAARWPVPVGKG
jgi:hypothetical protein